MAWSIQEKDRSHMKELLDVLEEIKQMGHYAVTLYYGGEIGEDDTDVPVLERRAIIIGVPVGFIGEVRRAWVAPLQQLLTMDLRGEPEQLPNPPGPGLERRVGIFAWGADDSIRKFMDSKSRFENREENP